jgi:segregation and condensation protein B
MFGTTKGFLDYFSLKKLDDLPPLADLSDWESLRVQLNLPDVEGEDGAGEIISDSEEVLSVEVDAEPAEEVAESTDGTDLPVLYPEGAEEQLEESTEDEEELPVSEWPEPVG